MAKNNEENSENRVLCFQTLPQVLRIAAIDIFDRHAVFTNNNFAIQKEMSTFAAKLFKNGSEPKIFHHRGTQTQSLFSLCDSVVSYIEVINEQSQYGDKATEILRYNY